MTGLDQAQNTSFPQVRERVNEAESTDLSPAAASGLSRESTGSPGLSTRPVDSALPSTEANHKAVVMHIDGCPECVLNTEMPRSTVPIDGGHRAGYECSDCGHA